MVLQMFKLSRRIDREAQRQHKNPAVVFVKTLTLTAGAAQKLMLFLPFAQTQAFSCFRSRAEPVWILL